MTLRDLRAERDLLTQAGGPDYCAAVIARLDAAEPTYGDSSAWAARDLLWRELREEAHDLGGWSVLALRRAELDGMPAGQLGRLRALLTAVARCGAQADVLIVEAQRLAQTGHGVTP